MPGSQDQIVPNPENEEFKTTVRACLQAGPVQVVFTKKDGTERTMLCTTSKILVPQEELKEDFAETKKQRKINPDVMPVYDLDAKAWKSFRWNSIKTVRSEA